MTLAEKIAQLTEQEKKEGTAIIVACESLKEALAKAESKIAEIVKQIGDIPQLQEEVAKLRTELQDANIAADAIASINAAPAVVDTPVAEPVTEPLVSESEPIENL